MKQIKYITFLLTLIALSLSASLIKAQGCEGGTTSEGDEGKPRIIGFIQPEFQYLMSKDDKLNIPDEATFKFRRARIGLTGNIPYDFSYYLMLETSTFVSATGNPYLLDAYVSYSRFKWAKVSLGSFKSPFGQEVNTACSGLFTIERAIVSDQIVSPQRDMGLMVLGGDAETKLNYAVAVMNGRGLGVKDNNVEKDFLGRITYKPLDFLRVGASFRYGWPNVSDKTRTSFAGELQFDYNNIFVQAEYIYDEGDYNRSAGGGCGSSPMTLGEKRDGFYAMAGYTTPWAVQPMVKFEMFDPDKDLDEDHYMVTSFGANYHFNDRTRLQVYYLYKAEYALEVPNDALQVQLQVKF